MTGSRSNGHDESVDIPRSALRDSYRIAQERTPLIRGEITESPEEAMLEIPLPVAIGEDSDPVSVLHVDDDPEITNVTAMFLERINDEFTVVSETTVVGALSRLRDEDVDCIISDYDMPNTDGLEFLEIVRERYPDLPFILFTGKGSEQIASKAIAKDVTDYMQKGVRADQYEVLANRVENAVEQYRTQQQFWNALSWYQRLVEQELAGVFIVQDGTFVYVNEKLADIFGHGQRDLVGETPLAITASEDEAVVREHLLDDSGDDGETFQYRFTGEAEDGSHRTAEVHGGAIEYDGSQAWIGILRDLSGRDSGATGDGN